MPWMLTEIVALAGTRYIETLPVVLVVKVWGAGVEQDTGYMGYGSLMAEGFVFGMNELVGLFGDRETVCLWRDVQNVGRRRN
jgi:hypothetical protein